MISERIARQGLESHKKKTLKMMMKGMVMAKLNLRLLMGLLLLCLGAGPVKASDSTSTSISKLPLPGMVTMIDLGAKKCIPCKMMAPIMEKMERKYKDKAAIVFIDVWEHREQAERFGIRAIPTQIFYDASGKEVFRHEGFMAEKDIVGMLKKMGVEP